MMMGSVLKLSSWKNYKILHSFFKVMGLGIWVLATGIGCKNVAVKHQGGSSLKGVYDERHLLRLSEITPGSSQYHFEACLMESPGIPQKGSCISTLKGYSGEGIVFQAELIPNISLSNTEKEKLSSITNDWRNYQRQLHQAKSLSHMTGVSGGVGAGLVLGNNFLEGIDVLKDDWKKANKQLAQDTTNATSKQKALDEALESLEKAHQKLKGEKAELVREQVMLVRAQRKLNEQVLPSKPIFIESPPPSPPETNEIFKRLANVDKVEADQLIIKLLGDLKEAGYSKDILSHDFDKLYFKGRLALTDVFKYNASWQTGVGLSNEFKLFVINHDLFRPLKTEMLTISQITFKFDKVTNTGRMLFADPWSLSRFMPTATEDMVREIWKTVVGDFIAQHGDDFLRHYSFDPDLKETPKYKTYMKVQRDAFIDFQRVKKSLYPDRVAALKAEDIGKAFLEDPMGMLEDMATFEYYDGLHPSIRRKFDKVKALWGTIEVNPEKVAARREALTKSKAAFEKARADYDRAAKLFSELDAAVDSSKVAVANSSRRVNEATRVATSMESSVLKLRTAVSKARQAVASSTTAVADSRTLLDNATSLIRGYGRGVLGVIVGGAAVTVGIFTAVKYLTKDAEKTLKEKEVASLQVLFDQNSSLFTTDPNTNTQVPSVQRVLEHFSSWQKQGWLDVNNSGVEVHRFCLPKAVVEGEVKTECYWTP